MNLEPPPLPPKKPLALPVIMAFVPSALALLLFSFTIPKAQLTQLCIAAAVVSVICCAVSSIMLFKRNTTAAIIFGILLALLNLAVSAGLGCAALLVQ
ncbi:MAG: hypothetical protein ABJF10_10105 [Chthoniobacter sp.]|uniref:hypothetical protein n=1 Tax=Chthoniobacter sp. TaxID=2510640 RepID=UPI0032A80CFF